MRFECEDQVRNHVNILTLYPDRYYQHRTSLEFAASYIETYFVLCGGEVSVQDFTVNENEYKYRNICCAFGPENGGPNHEKIIIGAHYDTVSNCPGADDNASGVACLLALATYLSEHPPTRRIELVAYALEEPPFFNTEHMGSFHHASREAEHTNDLHTAAIALDMLGYYSDDPDSQHYPMRGLRYILPKRGNTIMVFGRYQDRYLVRKIHAIFQTYGLPVFSLAVPSLFTQYLYESDHINYWFNGFIASFITNSGRNRNSRYHTSADTPDTLRYDRIAQITEALGFLLTCAERLLPR